MSTEPRDNRPPEMPAMKTTIVGGRPPGAGMAGGAGSYGIEILLKKAAVDAEFRALLLEKRAGAAAEIEGLTLEPAEVAMLNSVPAGQLEAIIAATKVPEDTRRSLLGKVTVAALAAVGIAVVVSTSARTAGISPDRLRMKGNSPEFENVKGILPDRPPTGDIGPDRPSTEPDSKPPTDRPETQPNGNPPSPPVNPTPPAPTGIRPDKPVSRGIQPDKPGRGAAE
jgi:hypothetical protein